MRRIIAVLSLAAVLVASAVGVVAPVGGVVASAGGVAAPAGSVAASAETQLKDVSLPPISEKVLGNGLRVCVIETREVPLVALRLLVPAGSAADPAAAEGTAGLTARLLLKGAGGLGAEQISEAIENVGGWLEASAGRDFTIVAGDFLARDLELALEHLARAVTAPDFPEAELVRERSLVVAELARVKENPGALATREFLRHLLAGHPYGNPVDGYPGAVGSLTREDVAAFHRRYYVPRGCILAVVGDVDARKTLRLAEKLFGRWTGGADGAAAAPLEPLAFPGGRVVVIDQPDLTQSQIRIGNRAAAMNDPAYFELDVANNILGGGFTSRLMDEIRVNRGLTYGVRSMLGRYRAGGFFGVSTFTKHATLRETIDVALGEIERMRTEPVGEEELAGARRYLAGLFPFRIETNSDLARWMTDVAFYGLGREFVETYRTRVGAVDSGGVRAAARERFHSGDNLILVLTSYAETAAQLEGLGALEVIPIDALE